MNTAPPDFARLAEDLEHYLALGPRARRWIAERGLDPERLAGAGWRSVEDVPGVAALANALEASGATWPGGLARPWLVLPVWDEDGRPVSVRARDLGGGPALALKGDTARLAGMDAAGLPPGGVLHVVEGETDWAALALAGALAVVGLPGCGSCHGAVVALARRTRPRLACLWLDADTPGRRAADALAKRLARAGVAAWDINPGHGDVGDLWKTDPDALRRAVRDVESEAPAAPEAAA